MGYTNPLFNVRKISGGYQIYPHSLTTDDLTINANATDTYSKIMLYGNAGIWLFTASGSAMYIYNSTTAVLKLYYDAGNNQYELSTQVADKDFYLGTTGTGVLKFGTKTASVKPIDGYITIKTADGNPCYLATVNIA